MNFDSKIDDLKIDIINAVSELVKIKSVQDEMIEGMPFGKGAYEALHFAVKLSQSMGFNTKEFDGYAAHGEFGNGEETVGVLAHLDVVPEGDGWKYNPYGGEIHDGKIWGRGAIDDKGPAIAALFAAKAVMDSSAILRRKIRIIFGTNEETGSNCIKYYLDHHKSPDMAFVPDAGFPVINGEKGILNIKLSTEFPIDNSNSNVKVIKIKGGQRTNIVPDYCEVEIKASKNIADNIKKIILKADKKIEIEERTDRIIIKSYGISFHGSAPQRGVNAISELMVILNAIDNLSGELSKFVKVYCNNFYNDFYGEKIGCSFEKEKWGKLTVNVGTINFKENKMIIELGIRYPEGIDYKYIIQKISSAFKETTIKASCLSNVNPLFVPEDSELVKKLMNVYKDFTGEEGEPLIIGGGTYARTMNNAVAFGPLFPGQKGLAHQVDEYIEIEELIKITKIYAKALYELAK